MAACRIESLLRPVNSLKLKGCSFYGLGRSWLHSVGLQATAFRMSPGATSLSFQKRQTSGFLNTGGGDRLWESATSVSSQGKKKGRGKNMRVRKVDLNRGQQLGTGMTMKVAFPGLNTPIGDSSNKGLTKAKVDKQVSAENIAEQKLAYRTEAAKGRSGYMKILPLQRGWSGNKWPGMSLGPPDPTELESFENYDSRCLEFRFTSFMTGTLGRKKAMSATVVVGNKQGLAGWAVATSSMGSTSLRKAKNSSLKKLQFVELFENRTIYHNFFSQCGQIKVYAYPRQAEHGLQCHKAIKTICGVIGIKDLYAEVEGNQENIKGITEAFFNGLQKQEVHQSLADRTGLNVVKIESHKACLPTLIASPQTDTAPVPLDSDFDLTRMYFDGKTPLVKKKQELFFFSFPSHQRKLRLDYRYRNQDHCKMLREAGLW